MSSIATLRLVFLCAVCYFLDGFANSILGPLAPMIKADLGLGDAELGPIFSANLAGQTIGLLVIPIVAGAIGHRKAVIGCITLFGALEALTAYADTANQLIAMRFITGIGLGGTLPSVLAMVAQGTPAERRGSYVMALFLAYALGPVVAGFVGPLVAGEGDWRLVLIIAGAASLVFAIIAKFWLKESVQTAEQQEQTASMAAPRPWDLFSRNLWHPTVLLWLVFISGLMVSFCFNNWLPTLLNGLGFSTQTSSLAVSTFNIGGLLATVVTGFIIDRLGSRIVLVSFFFTAAGGLFLLQLLIEDLSGAAMLTLVGGIGFFMLGAYAGINVLLTQIYPPNLRAIGAGWAKSAGRLGTIGAPIAIGLALAAGGSEVSVLGYFTIPAVVAGIAILCLPLNAGNWTCQSKCTAGKMAESG